MKGALTRLNPYIVVIYYVLVMVLGILVKHPLHLAVLFLCGIVVAVMVAGLRVTARTIGYGLIMSALIVLINPLVSKEGVTRIVEWGEFYITLESVVYGAVSALMLMTVFVWFVSWNVIMTGDKYIYTLGRVLPSVSLLISLILRLIPELEREYNDIKTSIYSMRLYDVSRLRGRFSLSVHALRVLIAHSIETSALRADSMEARGYGIAHRSCYLGYKWRVGDTIFITLTLLLGGMAIAGHVLHHSYASFYPIINVDMSGTYTFVSFAVIALYGLVPVLFETKEAIAWKVYLSHISR